MRRRNSRVLRVTRQSQRYRKTHRNAHVIFTFTATDQDGDDLTFTLREGQSRDLFVIEKAKSANRWPGEEVWSGELHVKSGVILDFEDAGYDPRVHVEANDPEGLNATLLLTVNLSNVNDNDPAFDRNACYEPVSA